MKNIIWYLVAMLLLCFMIPILFTEKFEVENAVNINSNDVVVESLKQDEIVDIVYDYREYNTVKLLHVKTEEIEEIPLDEYLYSVVSAEMPASFEEEALKAQAIVARTYTLFKMKYSATKHGEADLCDDSTCCQAWISKEDRLEKWGDNDKYYYWDKITKAVNETKGKVIMYENDLINAFFHSNSGGKTEPPVNVWGGTGYPYLKTVETSGEENYSQYSSEVELTIEEFTAKIKEKYEDFEIDLSKEDSIKVLEYTDGDRVKTIKIGNVEMSGVEVRTVIGLKSANFKITVDVENNKIKFEVVGYGHGVGMSQTGADSLAKQGKKCEDIVKHYYTGVEIKDF